MYWHSWNEGICQTRSQKLARTSTRPLYNPVQTTPVVSLKQGNKCTIALTAMQKSWKLPEIPGKVPPNSVSPAFPKLSGTLGSQERSRRKYHWLYQLQKNSHCAQTLASITGYWGWRRTEQWESQQVASCKKEKIFQVSNILMPSENEFNTVFLFLLYLVSWTPHGETVCSVCILYKPSSLWFTAFVQYRNKRN